MSIDVQSVVVCDEIRKEISQKDILIGVYGGEIMVPAYPAQMKLSFWIEILHKGGGEFDLDFTITTPSGNPPIQVGVHASIEGPGQGSFAFNGVPVSAERDGEIVVTMRVNGQEPKIIKRKSVKRGKMPVELSTVRVHGKA